MSPNIETGRIQLERGAVTEAMGCIVCRLPTDRVFAFRRFDEQLWQRMHLCNPCCDGMRAEIDVIEKGLAAVIPLPDVSPDLAPRVGWADVGASEACLFCRPESARTSHAIVVRWPKHNTWIGLAACPACFTCSLAPYLRQLGPQVTPAPDAPSAA